MALLAALGAGVFDAYPPALIDTLRGRLPAWLDARAGELVQAVHREGRLDEAGRAALAEQVGALCAELAGGAP